MFTRVMVQLVMRTLSTGAVQGFFVHRLAVFDEVHPGMATMAVDAGGDIANAFDGANETERRSQRAYTFSLPPPPLPYPPLCLSSVCQRLPSSFPPRPDQK